ncbi:MAG: hypothetical protein EXQ92_12035 [Alphaproteobacteria bacterium]|nr:hypothetical protein [Alphaproteobacteria bacterium]
MIAVLATLPFAPPLVLAGCAGPPPVSATQPTAEGDTGQSTPGFAQLTDIPMPARASIDLGRTLILGSEDGWIGRVALSTRASLNDLYDFYEREMTRFGWRKLTSVRSATSVLTYSRDKRIATIAIAGATLGGSTADITVSPAGSNQVKP